MTKNMQTPTFVDHRTGCDLHNNPDEAYVFIDVAYDTQGLSSAAAMVSIPGVGFQPLTGVHVKGDNISKYEIYEKIVTDVLSALDNKQADSRYHNQTTWVIITDNNQLVHNFGESGTKLAKATDAFLDKHRHVDEVVAEWTSNQDCPCMARVRKYAYLIRREQLQRDTRKQRSQKKKSHSRQQASNQSAHQFAAKNKKPSQEKLSGQHFGSRKQSGGKPVTTPAFTAQPAASYSPNGTVPAQSAAKPVGKPKPGKPKTQAKSQSTVKPKPKPKIHNNPFMQR